MIEQFGQHAEAYIEQQFQSAKEKLNTLCAGEAELTDVIAAAKEVNSWLKQSCVGNQRRYREECWRVVPVDGFIYVYQGELPSTDPDIEAP